MPTYEYECQECGHRLEAFQSMTEKPLKDCPECGKPALKRLIGLGAGIIFKGSGFYETDYKRPAQKKTESQDKKTGASDSSTKKQEGADGGSSKGE